MEIADDYVWIETQREREREEMKNLWDYMWKHYEFRMDLDQFINFMVNDEGNKETLEYKYRDTVSHCVRVDIRKLRFL